MRELRSFLLVGAICALLLVGCAELQGSGTRSADSSSCRSECKRDLASCVGGCPPDSPFCQGGCQSESAKCVQRCP